MLLPRVFLLRIAEQVEPLQHVKEHCIADRKDPLSACHSIILGDHLLLSGCERRMGRDLKLEMLMPELVLFSERSRLSGRADFEDSRQQKIGEELFVM